MPARFHAVAVLTVAGVAVVALGCLPAFAPNLRPRGAHVDLRSTTASEVCMGCHVSEGEALELGPEYRASAPIVADWMVSEARACADCHRVADPSRRGGQTAMRVHARP